jgi:pimeloyl-ACP methyl ester carboxylesterase
MKLDELSCIALARKGALRTWQVVDGFATHALEAGTGAATAVWMPALGDAASAFGAVLLALATRLDAGVRIIAVDPPGYGSSPAPDGQGPPSFTRLSRWAEAFATQQRGPTVWMGNSSGGALATAAAVAAGDEGSGLVLVGWPDWRFGDPPDPEVLCPGDPEGLLALQRRAWHRPPTLPGRSVQSLLERASAPAYRSHVASFDALHFSALLQGYGGPLALIGGLSDGLVPPDVIAATAASRPGAKVRWLEASGHYPHKERPDALAEVLTELLQDLLAKHRRG